MGVTFECARCHDHKYDPIKQRDYYRLYAFFNNVPEIGEDGRVANAVPILPAPTEAQQKRLEKLGGEIALLSSKLAAREKSWAWRDENAAGILTKAAQKQNVDGAILRVACNSLVPAVADKACSGEASEGKPETAPISITKRLPLTMGIWFKATAADRDVSLLSSMNYATSTAATTYGNGMTCGYPAENWSSATASASPPIPYGCARRARV